MSSQWIIMPLHLNLRACSGRVLHASLQWVLMIALQHGKVWRGRPRDGRPIFRIRKGTVGECYCPDLSPRKGTGGGCRARRGRRYVAPKSGRTSWQLTYCHTESETAGPGKFLSFSGDADEDAEPIVPGSKEDVPFDLFGEAQKAAEREEEEEEEEGDEEGEDAEPEDDFNAAWEVLDLARALFEKQQDAEGDAVALKLADTFLALGDVSLETEKFEQAIADYGQALALKVDLLPQSSRQIAEAHYKLSIVLDLTSGRLNDAITHAERALDSVEARLAELRDALSGQGLVTPVVDEKADPKGKGKAKGPRLLGDDAVQHLNRSQMEAEVKELQGLKEDLALKVRLIRCKLCLSLTWDGA